MLLLFFNIIWDVMAPEDLLQLGTRSSGTGKAMDTWESIVCAPRSLKWNSKQVARVKNQMDDEHSDKMNNHDPVVT